MRKNLFAQILVIVANTQVKTPRTEEVKGSVNK